MTITNNLQEIINNYNNKYLYKSVVDGKTYVGRNDLSDNGHVNQEFEKGEWFNDYFTWPGEKIEFGTYRIGDITWEKLCAGQVFVMNIKKGDDTRWRMSNGLDFKYKSYETRRVFDKEDWEEVKKVLVDNFGEDGMLEFNWRGFTPINEKFKKDCEAHDKAMCKYMENEIKAGHLVD